MRSGTLRHSITIQKRVSTAGPYGGEVISWEALCTVSASIEPLQGREFIAAQAAQSETTAKIRIRYRAGITSDMRILFGARTFAIKAPPINPGERNQELILMVSEGVSNGY